MNKEMGDRYSIYFYWERIGNNQKFAKAFQTKNKYKFSTEVLKSKEFKEMIEYLENVGNRPFFNLKMEMFIDNKEWKSWEDCLM